MSDGENKDPFASEEPEPSTFDKVIKTITFSNGYQKDGQDAGFKALAAASMDSSSAISGVKAGTKQTIIRGDVVHHFKGNHYVIVDKNDTLFVNEKQSVTVEGNTQHLYNSNFLRAVKGNDYVRVNSSRNLIVLGETTEDYLGTHEITAPEEFEWKSFERGFSFTKLDLMGIGFDFHGAEITGKGADVDVGVENAEGAVFHQEIKFTKEKENLFHQTVGVAVDVLLRVDAMVDIGVGTPFR
jgi:hypothetical protein